MAENRVRIVITGDSRGAIQALAEVEQHSRRLSDTFREIGKTMLGVAGGMALFETAKRAISSVVTAGLGMNAQLEQAAIQFKVLTGSAAEAQKIVKYLYDYAGKTPFEFQGVLQAASVVRGAKLEMEKWIPVIGDMAAAGQAAGLTMDQVARAIARVRSGNVGEFFEAVGAYLGITRQDLIKYGIAWEASGELADRSAAGIQRVLEAIYEEATRRFRGMAEEQSNTFAGMWSTIRDTFGMIQAEVMKPFFQTLRDRVMPALRELSGRFLEAYRAGGLLAGLKAVVPPGLADVVEKIAQAWDALSKAGSQLWAAIRPLGTELGRLAGAVFAMAARAAAELVRALADLVSKVMSIPGMTFAVQALASAFLLFRVIPSVLSAVGRAILKLTAITGVAGVVVRAIQVMQIQWILGAQAGASFVARLIAVFKRLGAFIFGMIPWWGWLAGAIVAAALVIKRQWATVGPFFAAVGKMMAAAANWAKYAVITAFEEMNYGVTVVVHSLRANVANSFASLVRAILPLVGKILPDTWEAAFLRVAEAAGNFALSQQEAINVAAARLASAKLGMGEAAGALAAAWAEVKSAGSAAWSGIREEVSAAVRAVTGNLGEVQPVAEDAADGLKEDLAGGAQEAAGKTKELEDALQKLLSAAGSAADAVAGLFSQVPRAVGAGSRAVAELAREVQLAMVKVEEYVAAGGGEAGQELLARLRSALGMLPGLARDFGSRAADLLIELGRAAARLAVVPMEEARRRAVELGAAVNLAWMELRDRVRDYARAAVEHLANIGAITGRMHADRLRQLINVWEWSTEERWRLEEELYRKNLDLLEDQVEAVKKAYEDRLAAIDEATEREVALLEARLEALEESDRLADRERARREHEKKLQELYEKRRYHELRTGREHRQALADIEKEIAEEQQRWEDEQRQWSLDEQKKQIRKEIDLVKERAEERKKALKKEFEDTLKLYDGQFKELSARVAVWEPQYLDRFAEVGRKAIEALAAGQREGLPALEAVRREIEGYIPGLRVREEKHVRETVPEPARVPKTVVLLPGQYELIDDRAAMWARELVRLLELPEPQWLQDTGQVSIGGRVFSPLDLREGRSYLSVREVAEAFGWRVLWDDETRNITLQKAHRGARVRTPGIAELIPGEIVFPPGLSRQLERLIAVLAGGLPTAQVNFNGPLFSAERVAFEDRSDIDYLSRQLARAVARLASARG
jgi:hypothetical protein